MKLMDTLATLIGSIFMLFGAVVLLGLILSWPLSLLWNGCLVPAVSGLHEVGVLQMWGILILSGALFKNSSHSKSKD